MYANLKETEFVNASVENKINVDVDNALKIKRNELAQQLREIEASISQVREEYSAKIEQLQMKKKPLEEALSHLDALLSFEVYPSDTRATSKIDIGEAVTTVKRDPILDAAFYLLKANNHPMHYKDIADRLKMKNIYIPGRYPPATLLSRMIRDRRFKRTRKRGIYALSSWRQVRRPKVTTYRTHRKRWQ